MANVTYSLHLDARVEQARIAAELRNLGWLVRTTPGGTFINAEKDAYLADAIRELDAVTGMDTTSDEICTLCGGYVHNYGDCSTADLLDALCPKTKSLSWRQTREQLERLHKEDW